jgi:L-alanine-DL-glutamate epimerase-like enolase superfamily enzyme
VKITALRATPSRFGSGSPITGPAASTSARLAAFKKAAAIAESAGISICLHGQSVTGMTDLAQHQVGLTLPNLADGNQIMHQLLAEDILETPDLTQIRGQLEAAVALGPGLGFELNWDAVARAHELYETDESYHHS